MIAHSFGRMHLRPAAMLAACAAVLACAGCDSHSQAEAASAPQTESAAAAPIAAPAAAQGPAPVASDPKSFTTSGPLVAAQQADISAERDGLVVSITVQIGDHVRKGQVMASLDDRVLRSECDSQKARIASARAEVRDWEAEEKSATADLQRADIMRADKILSEQDWEHVKYKLDETVAEVARYRDEAAEAEADLQTATLQLEQSNIAAPFNGVVGRSSVRLAQQVKAGDVLFWITAEAPLQVLFTVPETEMADFSAGKALLLTTADYPGLRQQGRIVRVSPVVDPASGSVQVIGAVVRPSPRLKPGMSMQVRLAP